MSDESEMSQPTAEPSTLGLSAEERRALRERKALIVNVGVVVIVVLVIINCILLYLYLSGGRTNVVTKRQTRKENIFPVVHARLEDKGQDEYEDLTPEQDRSRRPSRTTGCRWLATYFRANARAPSPCDDFYGYVCSDRPRSLYQDGVSRLMRAMAPHLAGSTDGEPSAHVSLFNRCVNGTAVRLEPSAVIDSTEGSSCPARIPPGPRRASDSFFRDNPNATVADFRDFIKRIAPRARMDNTIIEEGQDASSLPAKWMAAIVLWVARSARCHLEYSLGRVLEKGRLYEDMWQLLYFAPLMGSQADAVLALSYGNVPEPRLHACLELLEDIFAAPAIRAASVALQDAVDDLPGTVVHWVWEARQVLSPRLAAWVTSIVRGEIGENVDKYVLDTVNSLKLLEAATFNGPGKDSSDMSIFSWSVLHEQHRRALVIPHGLLGVLVNASSTVEPIFVPAVGAQILRALLPRRNGPYPWPRSHHVHLHHITGCFARSLHVVADIALEVAKESAVLVPLFDLYRRKVREETGDGTRLHPDHTNGQLFFVLWALGHCGETDGAVLVNGAARHSALFRRTFFCHSGQLMATGKQCSFWQ